MARTTRATRGPGHAASASEHDVGGGPSIGTEGEAPEGNMDGRTGRQRAASHVVPSLLFSEPSIAWEKSVAAPR